MNLIIRQIISNIAPMWAEFSIEGKIEYAPIICFALTEENKIIALAVDEKGIFFDPKESEMFVKMIFTIEPEIISGQTSAEGAIKTIKSGEEDV